MRPRHQTNAARSAVMPSAAMVFASLDSVVLIGLSGLVALFSLLG